MKTVHLHKCICTKDYTGANCTISTSRFINLPKIIITFTNVQITYTIYLNDDLKELAAEKLLVHPTQIDVKVIFPPTARRRNADGFATVTFTITDSNATNFSNLKDDDVFFGASMSVGDDNNDEPSSSNLGLIIGLSVGGGVFLSVIAFIIYKQCRKQKKDNFLNNPYKTKY